MLVLPSTLHIDLSENIGFVSTLIIVTHKSRCVAFDENVNNTQLGRTSIEAFWQAHGVHKRPEALIKTLFPNVRRYSEGG